MLKKYLRTAVLCVGAIYLPPTLAEAQQLKAEVMNWWTSGTEQAALQELEKAFKAAGGTWIDRAVPDFNSAIAAASSSMINGSAPTAMQFNGGTQFTEMASAGYLTDLTPLAAEGGWADQISPALRKSISVDGKLYALPVDMSNQLWLFTSKAAFEKAGVERPRTWDEFMASLDKFKSAGILPIAMGGDTWQNMLLLQAVLLFRGQPDLYEALFVKPDVTKIRSDAFKSALDDFRKISSYLDPSFPSMKWNDASALVAKGTAAMQVMGDWAKPEFVAAGLAPDEGFGCELGIGKNKFYVAVTDVFVLPKNGEQAAAQALFAKTVMAPEVQVAFNIKKGGLPPRKDAPMKDVDRCTGKASTFIAEGGTQFMAPMMTLSADRYGAVGDIVAQFMTSPNMTSEQLVESLVEAIESTK